VEHIRSRMENSSEHRMRNAVLDFRQVTGLDSTAMLSFSRMVQLVEEFDATLILTSLSETITNQFENAKIPDSRSVVVLKDLDEGIESCEDGILASASIGREDRSLEDFLMEIYPDRERINALADKMRPELIEGGTRIIRQGDRANDLFFIEKGQLSAHLEMDQNKKIRLETMRGGNVVGEIGFYLGGDRTASVIADEPTRLYSLTLSDLEKLEQDDPAVAVVFHRVMACLLAERVVHLVKTVEGFQK
jgi:SulP family sulfate permease